MLDALSEEGQHLAHVSKDDIQIWELIEESAVNHPQRMSRGLRCEPSGSTKKQLVPLVHPLIKRSTRMQINGDAKI